MLVRLLIAVTVLQVMMGLTATLAEARNRYRVERIYRLSLQPGEACARAWRAHYPNRAAYSLSINGAGNAQARFGLNSFVTRDGRRCIVTVFSITDRIE